MLRSGCETRCLAARLAPAVDAAVGARGVHVVSRPSRDESEGRAVCARGCGTTHLRSMHARSVRSRRIKISGEPLGAAFLSRAVRAHVLKTPGASGALRPSLPHPLPSLV
jgi:hypothetical protein